MVEYLYNSVNMVSPIVLVFHILEGVMLLLLWCYYVVGSCDITGRHYDTRVLFGHIKD